MVEWRVICYSLHKKYYKVFGFFSLYLLSTFITQKYMLRPRKIYLRSVFIFRYFVVKETNISMDGFRRKQLKYPSSYNVSDRYTRETLHMGKLYLLSFILFFLFFLLLTIECVYLCPLVNT